LQGGCLRRDETHALARYSGGMKAVLTFDSGLAALWNGVKPKVFPP
jgi:hypothetical protein